MKDIVIIGGAGPESGILLVKLIIKTCQQKFNCVQDSDFPYIALFSFPFSDMLQYENKTKVTEELENLIQRECSSAKIWMIACNTLHVYLKQNSIFPNTFINILEIFHKKLTNTPVVFCSSTSRKYRLHQKYFKCEYPCDSKQKIIDELIFQLNANKPTEAHFKTFSQLLDEYNNRQIFLGCTEFSLLNYYFTLPGIIIDPLQEIAYLACEKHFERK